MKKTQFIQTEKVIVHPKVVGILVKVKGIPVVAYPTSSFVKHGINHFWFRMEDKMLLARQQANSFYWNVISNL